MNELRILGINVFDRIKEAGRTQAVLSRHAHCIKTRLGFHELSDDICSRNAFILLELKGSASDWDDLYRDLSGIGGLDIKVMSFDLDGKSGI
jgi:hypothetical protein